LPFVAAGEGFLAAPAGAPLGEALVSG